MTAPESDSPVRRPASERETPTTSAAGARLALLLGSVTLAFAIAEVSVRLLDIRPHSPALRQVEALQPDGTWAPVAVWGTGRLKRESPFPEVAMGEFVPGSRFRFVYYDDVRDIGHKERAVRIAAARINAHGLRGPDFPVAKPEGTTRILIVGDSFTFGEGVDDGRPFPSLLQRSLDAQPGATVYHVINAGVSGYNTRDEVTYLERRWLALEPDLVVLVFYLNDAYDDARFAELIMGGARGQLEKTRESPIRLWEILATRHARWRASRRLTHVYRAQFSGSPAIEGHDWEGSKGALARAAALTRERGARFAVVIFPELHDLDDAHPFASIYEQVARHAETLGVPVLDLFPAFRGRRAETLWVHDTDHHPNEHAHEVAAGAIWTFLHDPAHGLLAPAPP